ncbi:MAG: YitT family protein, partial [Acholeplasmataceae bacterium]
MAHENKYISYILITIGVIILHFGFYFFLVPEQLVTGGVMGLSVLIAPLVSFLSVGNIYLILNIIALILGGVLFGKTFFIRTVYASLLAPLLVSSFEYFGVDENYFINFIDPNYRLLVASIAGGILIGAGIGMVLRYNATTGGMDVIQKMIHQYLKVPFSTAVYISDGIIVLIGMFLSFQNGLFAVLSIFMMTYMLEKTVVYGNHAFAIFIITSKSDEIKEAIFKD